MGIYIAILLWLIIIGMISLQTKSKFIQEKSILIFYVFFIFIYACRSQSVGFDYSVYRNVYNLFEKYGMAAMKSGYSFTMEKGYLMINWLFTSMHIDIHVFQALIAIGIVWFINKFIIMEKDSMLLTVFFLYTLGFFFNAMNQIRSLFAAAMCLYAISVALNKKYKKAIVLIMLACTLHVSVIISFVFIFIIWRNIKINAKNVILSSGLCVTVIVLWNSVLGVFLKLFPKYTIYFSEDKAGEFIKSGNITYLLLFVCIFAFAIYKRPSIIEQGNEMKIKRYDTLLWMTIFGMCISIIVLKLSMVQRFIILPLFSSSMLIAMAIKSERNGKNRLIWLIFISCALCAYMYIYLNVAQDGLGRDGVVPYKFYWNK